ncbi:hypothetical protein CHF27_003710 [Romboutsia maritimum]|uniref:Uncharacterized protein n=1 Tax=Romboutsia maritimum TaxID=2020948 RepID=A0A371IUP7_9FIRM|nr:hypothetical protein CHF27_003710 [Romboutsia maritimum]
MNTISLTNISLYFSFFFFLFTFFIYFFFLLFLLLVLLNPLTIILLPSTDSSAIIAPSSAPNCCLLVCCFNLFIPFLVVNIAKSEDIIAKKAINILKSSSFNSSDNAKASVDESIT